MRWLGYFLRLPPLLRCKCKKHSESTRGAAQLLSVDIPAHTMFPRWIRGVNENGCRGMGLTVRHIYSTGGIYRRMFVGSNNANNGPHDRNPLR